ncbi:purine-nucleoside phosphorylase [Alicyclobacillus mengziensis]|uniref:Purine nucleoside phosphorylase DeoD-type n=1 Tax=Alicyclobacillus mengziensis TaxID=2931921 RepID=A0A9X7VZX9_9BACL|nr:purine-nucleoside phosphorylase [Alicyclobacillus mengziensis]QSO47670.1 purine-nucleoside phosphorylase [Alicyclobacillus mengziensis]
MSVHIAARDGEIADAILLPGDPLRAKHIAETFLENPKCYNEVRGMLGYTGEYQGKRVSVQGTGMGTPSISIYANELMQSYGVRSLIRVGTCGAYQTDVHVRDLVLAMTASTDSAVNRVRFPHLDFAPAADFRLLYRAYQYAVSKGMSVHVGPVFTSDSFYRDEEETVQKLTEYGTLAVDMETAALYTLAAKYNARALSVLTVSDHMVTGEETTAEERRTSFADMVEVALNVATAE